MKKEDSFLKLHVDYCALNKITVQNQYPLPLIPKLLDQVRTHRVFTKLDLMGAYNLIRKSESSQGMNGRKLFALDMATLNIW